MSGARRGSPRLRGRQASKASQDMTILICLLHARGLSFDRIAARLLSDFGITLTRSAVWQRWRRNKLQGIRTPKNEPTQ